MDHTVTRLKNKVLDNENEGERNEAARSRCDRNRKAMAATYGIDLRAADRNRPHGLTRVRKETIPKELG